MPYRVVGANFDQMHMNTNLQWFHDHPEMDVVGVCDENPDTSTGSLDAAAADLDLSDDAVYDDLDACLTNAEPDVVLGCPMNSEHAGFVGRVAEHDVHVAVEKPMAVTLADADRMIDAMAGTGNLFVINWPVMWDPIKHTIKRLVEEGTVGDVIEVQYYGGNAGAPPDGSWFYDDESGGGSMLDYLGYGATFSTWFRGGDLPESVTAERYVPAEMDVDVQSSTVCRYEEGLSTLQTTWRMLTNPWETEPQNAKGYEIVGTEGAISTRDPRAEIRVTTDDRPEGCAVEPDDLPERFRNLASYLADLLAADGEPEGPADPAFCREAHRIIETARRSADAGKRLPLVE